MARNNAKMFEKELDRVAGTVFDLSPEITGTIIIAIKRDGSCHQTSNIRNSRQVAGIYRYLADRLDPSPSSSARTTKRPFHN